ncbi:hypothetical protein E2320_020497 [Naja naja]|nr:hypothetical protein E2320_020497 [Naja naja]
MSSPRNDAVAYSLVLLYGCIAGFFTRFEQKKRENAALVLPNLGPKAKTFTLCAMRYSLPSPCIVLDAGLKHNYSKGRQLKMLMQLIGGGIAGTWERTRYNSRWERGSLLKKKKYGGVTLKVGRGQG